MSKFLTPAIYSNKALENQWVNTIFNTHDLMCGCNSAIKHLADILYRQPGPNQLCLPSTSEDARGQPGEGAAELPIDEGDLEALFEEPFTEDEG